MGNKTYEQRLAEMAEEMFNVQFAVLAKENESTESFDTWKKAHNDEYTEALDSMYLPLAAIALKHMAEMYDKGYEAAFYDGDAAHKEQCNYNLQSLGLIQPQKP